MRVVADLHIHSRFSRATSQKLTLIELDKFAKIKGLNIIGTGDFTHPKWLKEITENLLFDRETRTFTLPHRQVKFMMTTEVCTVFESAQSIKKVHHVILTPDLELATQINERLAKYGDLAIDGRPTLNVDAATLVEEVISVSHDNLIFPSHIWTPWFGIFGAFSGFDRIEDCYKDMTKHIHALETGLSCYDEETEVLTNNGWKKFFQIQDDDEICTLNQNNHQIEFQKTLKKFEYSYKGKMYRLKTKRVDLLVTPNHKLFVAGRDFHSAPKFFLKEASFLFNKGKRFKKNGVWIGKNPQYFILPAVKMRWGCQHYSNGSRIKQAKQIPIEPWLKFFGFWLAEGWTTEDKKGHAYCVCLSNQNKTLLSEIKAVLESFGYNVYLDKKTNTIIRMRNYQLFCYLRQFGKSHDKFIPQETKTLSKELLNLFFAYYIKGNGHIYGRRKKGLSATTISVRLRDDLQEIALKRGISAYYKLGRGKGTVFRSPTYQYKRTYKQSADAWIVYFIRKNLPSVSSSEIKKYHHTETWIDFNGKVYSLAVPNNVIYVRRNGVPVWCGNSDPPMNWRLSALDRFTLVSNSDSHSFWPWRIGREANVFELKKASYYEIVNAIRSKDVNQFKFTIETDPAYGKYHWTGHRNCHVSLSSADAKKLSGFCPVCRRKLTKGVEQRVEELADRPLNYTPEKAIGFVRLLPLSEIIAAVLNSSSPSTKRAWELYNRLISKFGNEYAVLLNADEDSLKSVVDERLAKAIIQVRKGTIKIVPGYDGIYGQLLLGNHAKSEEKIVKQSNISDFFQGSP